MKPGKIFIVLGIVCLFAVRARASIDYGFLGYGLADLSGQLCVTIPTDYAGGEHVINGMWVGQVRLADFTTNQVLTGFCLSPDGGLQYGLTAYDPITPEAAKFGSDPSVWSTTGGIENAVYIWSQHGSTITSINDGAALGLALWAAIYNSTAVGSVNASGRFSVSGANPGIATAFASDLAELNAAGPDAVQATYNQNPASILRPVDTSMQDLIVAARPSSGSALAPEPSSFFALAALLATMGTKWLWQPVARFFGQRKKSGGYRRTAESKIARAWSSACSSVRRKAS